MTFTNGLLLLLPILLLSGCQLFFAEQQELPEVSTNSAEISTLSPVQKQAQALKSQGNLYQKKASQLSAAISYQTRQQFESAILLKRQGKLSAAKRDFLYIAQHSPDLSGAWLQLALINKQQSAQDTKVNDASLTERLGYLNNAISANAYNYYAHNELAQVLRQQGQFQQALSHYQLALKSWPAFAEAYLNRGILYDLYLGDKQLALSDYQLYQVLAEQESRQVKGWIIDLQRQLSQVQNTGKHNG